MRIRPLTTIEECAQVVALEREIWNYPDSADVVPAPLLIVSIKRGGILLGAFDEVDAMHGFIYSIPAIKHRQLTQWSHMLGVLPTARNAGLGAQLKLAQREVALQMGIDLIEWTFDPLQALNAHFNFGKLGTVADEYEENAYGQSSSPLHAGTPTDRIVAEWHIRRPHVERRLAAWKQPLVRDQSVTQAVLVNPSGDEGVWRTPGRLDLEVDARRILVEIPTGFSEMVLADQPLAQSWRIHTRTIFQGYFQRGYRAVDFFLSRETGRGQYLLVQTPPNDQ